MGELSDQRELATCMSSADLKQRRPARPEREQSPDPRSKACILGALSAWTCLGSLCLAQGS